MAEKTVSEAEKETDMEHAVWKKLIGQAVRFVGISGCGWLIDFGVYIVLTEAFRFPVAYANMISSIPAITLVFIVSTRKIFANRKEGLPLWGKYIVYFLYQMVLVFCISWVGEWLFRLLSGTALASVPLIADHLKILCKILITPITMTVNFFVMKLLCEKL